MSHPSTFDEYRAAYYRLEKENANLQALAQSCAENKRIMAAAALDHVSGKIDAGELVDLASSIME
jgi:hypothetical protein